ncbi:MAG: hypothetical protein WAN65_06215, partial [Candidatus Sulfotelmatobacter sp.]
DGVAKKHIDQCQMCRLNNMPPVPASGFTKRALEICGYIDPADAYLQTQKNAPPSPDVDELKKTVAALQDTINRLVVGSEVNKEPGAEADPSISNKSTTSRTPKATTPRTQKRT